MNKGKPILVLLVDDDPGHSEALRRALKASGMSVVIRQAGTLKKYREIAAVDRPDIAILDISLPDGRAVEVLTSPPETGAFPIIIVTSQGDELRAVETIKAGAMDYIVKSTEAFSRMPHTVERVLHEWHVLQERKQAEEALRESEEKYRAIIETNQEWIWQMDNKGIHTYSNPAIEQILGYSVGDIVGKDATVYMNPEDRRKIGGMLPGWIENKTGWSNLIVRWVHKDGSMRWLESDAVPLLDARGELIGFQGSDRDITERMQAEEALRESEERYRLISDHINDIVWQLDTGLRFVHVSPAVKRVLGYSIEEAIGLHVTSLMTEEGVAQMKRVIQSQRYRHEGVSVPNEYKMKHKDGHWVDVEVVSSPVFDKDGRPIGFAGVTRDITERKRAEEALRESQDRYRLLAETTQDMICVIDLDERVEYINAAATQAIGKQSQDIIGKAFADFFPPEIAKEQRLGTQRVFESGEPFMTETRVIVPHGEMWVRARLVPLRRERGKVTALMGVLHDITESRRLEETLRSERRELELMINTSPIIVFYKDKEGRFIRVNKTFAEALNRSEKDFLGKTVFDLYSPVIAQGMAEDDRGVLESGRAKVNIIEQYESSGGPRWVRTDKYPIFDENGVPVGLIGFAQDITERKQAEEALRESEEKYRTLFDNASEGIFVVQGGKLVFCNPMTTRMIGYSSEELRARPFTEFIHPDDRAMVVERHTKRLKGEELPEVYSFRILSSDGGAIWIDLRAVRINWQGQAATLNFASDVTDRKRAEEALSRAEENYRRTLDDSPLGVCIVTSEGETIYANRAILDIYGYDTIEELRATPIKNRYTPESYAEFTIRHQKRKQGEDGPSEYEISIVRKNGEVRHLQVSRKETLWNGEKQYQALYHDITERKRAVESLRESEEKYRTLFDNAGEAIFVAQGGKLVFSNPMTFRLLGYSREEIKVKPFADFIHPDDRKMVVERHAKRIQGDEVPPAYSFRIIDRDGHTRWIDIKAVMINWEGRVATLNFVSDITERKRAEEAIQASLREKEVLLREIHHRVKNNMQVISSLFNLQAGVIKDKEALRILKEGQTRIRSMALVHEKLYQSGDLSRIDLAGYIQALSAHLFHAYLVDSNQVRLETEFEDLPLDINTAMPCALILNELISNALKHAFPAGRKGVLSIRLRRGKDGVVELRIADDGVGFPEGLDFRRTDSLGLQIVNLLVGQLGGTIKMTGKKGAIFTVTFHEIKRESIKNPKAA